MKSENKKQAAMRQLFSQVGLLLEALFLIAVFLLLLLSPVKSSIKTFSLIFGSIVLEVMPFMLFGSLVGGLIEAFVSREKMTSLLPKNRYLTIFFAAGMGIIFPICECAIVPVVKRLAGKGLPASAAIAYLLGGPIVNPIVFISTALAYKLEWRAALLRIIIGFGTALIISLIIDRIFSGKDVFQKQVTEEKHDKAKHHHDHNHTGHSCDCGCGHDHGSHSTPFWSKFSHAVKHAADDFLGVGHFLIIGAFVAALAQTFIDRKIFLSLSGQPVLPTILMMTLAILLNLCSEADAFIAASFKGLMPFHSQMAFMVTGPMFDLKLLLMYQAVFKKKTIFVLSVLILAVIFVFSLIFELLGGGGL